jgi:hypothetical protein
LVDALAKQVKNPTFVDISERCSARSRCSAINADHPPYLSRRLYLNQMFLA